ncbi:iron transporter [Desulfococcaceae bacterium HSG9]|nr:iron transporter [Desulfococcaceae bacterium HSG9]
MNINSAFSDTLKSGLKSGLKKGQGGFLWMLKILIPISFATMLIDQSGLLNKIDFLIEPVMRLLSLPAMAALPLIIGMLTGLYGAIASMAFLPLNTDQMTLIAIFVLISHNLIQEGVIQGKSGIHPVPATLIRLAASCVTVIVSALFIKPAMATESIHTAALPPSIDFTTALMNWCVATGYLSLKIFVIIMGLMILLEIMKAFNLIRPIVKALNPVLWTMGLSKRVGMLWLTAAIFGLSYGGAVIVEEAKDGNLTKNELTKLHFSIGVNHSLIEDPALFLSLGLSPFWLWIPRLTIAILTVHLVNLWFRLKKNGVSST